MTRNALPLTLALGLALTLAATSPPAQASGPTGGVGGGGNSDRAHTVTVTRKLEVVEVLADYRLRVKDAEDATAAERVLRLDAETEIRAQDKQAFDGRKKLTFADLAVGHTLSVRMKPTTEEILAVKVLKEERS